MRDEEAAGPRTKDLRAQRLREARELLDLKLEEMGRAVGASKRSWQDWEKGRRVPDGDTYARLSELGLNGEWLLGGDGPALKKMPAKGGAGVLRTGYDLLPTAADAEGEYVRVRQYNVQASAGSGELVDHEYVVQEIQFRRDWLRRALGVSAANVVLLEAAGDSMKPTIEGGDMLLVDVGDPKCKGDGVYVLTYAEQLMVKRVEFQPDGYALVVADNPAYPGERRRFQLSELHIVGRVVWVGGRI